MGRGQGRARGNLYRSFANEHDGNHCSPEAHRAMAKGSESRITNSRTRRKAAHAWRHEYLDPTHQEPHRYAFNRDSLAGRRQGLWHRFEDVGTDVAASCGDVTPYS